MTLRRVLPAAVLAALVVWVALSFSLAGASAVVERPHAAVPVVARGPQPAKVTVRFSAGHAVAVPRSFFGLAMEWETIPIVAKYPKLLDRVFSLFRSGASGPLVLRVGGLSADDAIWTPKVGTALPARAIAITPTEIRELVSLVRAERLHVIIDLNLADDRSQQAARLAAYMRRRLPKGSITAFELGNEPDYYDHALRSSPAYYPPTFTAGQYASRFAAYARRLHAGAPGSALAGPALANPITNYDFLTRLLKADGRSVGMLTVHRYALSECAKANSPWYPTLTRLLRNSASTGLIESMSGSIALAHTEHLPIRLDEVNSVTCGGTLGVSDTFASALWMTDTLFAALAHGFTGVNVQSRVNALNSPFYLTSAGLDTRPLLYGMLLFTRAFTPGARLVSTRVKQGAFMNVNAWALRSRSGSNVVLLNKGSSGETVVLRLPRSAGASVQRMLAASIRTTSAVTLAGQRINAAGRWQGKKKVARVRWTHGGYRVFMPAFSGALVSVPR